METKELKFHNFSIDKLVELSKESGSAQFLAEKQSGAYEVMHLSSGGKIFTFYMTDCGEYVDEEYYPKRFAML